MDNTQRKLTDEALRESEERLRSLFETMAEGVILIAPDGQIVQANHAAESILGLERSEIEGRNYVSPEWEILRPDGTPMPPEEMAGPRAMKEKRPVKDVVMGVKRPDGSIVWINVSAAPIMNKAGRFEGVVGTFADITERKRAEEALRRRAEELAALQSTVLDITAPHDLPTLLQTIVERAALLLDARGGGMYLCVPNQGEVRCVVSYNTPHDYTGTILKYGEGAAGTVAQTGEPLIIENYRTWNRRAAVYEEEQPFTAVLSAPMIWQGQVTGVIHVLDDVESRRFTEADLELLTLFANHAAIAVENSRLYEQAQEEITACKRAEGELQRTTENLRKALGATIQAIALTVETKDAYTAGHQRRVADLARAIATEMGLSEEQIDGIRMAGVIHDIGKISVPGEILSKPGEISGIEFSLIKTHPQVGYDILKTIDFPWPVAQIVLQHHERMDGSGYPQGLSGEEIMLEARILAVTDVVEAMASHRPYRPAHSIEEALEEISQNRGVLYDPEVVDACWRLFTEKGFKFE